MDGELIGGLILTILFCAVDFGVWQKSVIAGNFVLALLLSVLLIAIVIKDS